MKTERRNACHVLLLFDILLLLLFCCGGGGASFRNNIDDRFWASIRCWKGCLFSTFRSFCKMLQGESLCVFLHAFVNSMSIAIIGYCKILQIKLLRVATV